MHEEQMMTSRVAVRRAFSAALGALVFTSIVKTASAEVPAAPTEEVPTAPAPPPPDGPSAEPVTAPPEEVPVLAAPPIPAATSGQATTGGSDLAELDSLSLEALFETKVVTATKTARTVEEAPAVISVVTRDDIARWGYQSLSEMLQHVVGFYIVDDHAIANAGVRGISGGLFGESSSIKLMIDGHSVAFRPTGGNWLGPELVPLSAVERVEIVRGPSSALYGADAFLGVVHIITRRGASMSGAQVRSWVDLGKGRDNGYDLDLSAGGRNGALEVMLAARFNRSDRSGLELPGSSPASRIPTYRLGRLESMGATGSTDVALASATYHFSEEHSLSVLGYYSTFNRGAEFSPWSPLSYGFDSEGRPHDTRIALQQGFIGLVDEVRWGKNNELAFRAYYFGAGPTSKDRIDIGSQSFDVRRDFGSRGFEGSAEAKFAIVDGLSSVAGAEAVIDREQLPSSLRIVKFDAAGFRTGDIAEALSTRQGSQSISNIGVYAQAMWTKLEPYLSAIGGARYDNHSIYGGQFSSRAGLVSNPTGPLFVKLLYGSAFKAPSPLLLYGVPVNVGDIIGNPLLKPQRVHTVEAQVAMRPLKSVQLATGVSYSSLSNKAEFAQQGVNRAARNLSQVSMLTWETELNVHFKDYLQGYASFELPWATRDLGSQGYAADLIGKSNVIYPRYVGRGGATIGYPNFPVKMSGEVITVGRRRASEMNILEARRSYDLESYTMVDLSIFTSGIQFLEGRETTISFKVKNVADARASDPGFAGVDYPLLGRSAFVQLRQEL